MDEKQKNDAKKIMLVQEAKDGNVKAVTKVDKDGNIQTTDPTQQNMADLLNVNTSDSFVEAFFKKLMEQAGKPSHTGIFVMVEDVLNKLIKTDLDPQELEKYRVDPAAELSRKQDSDTTQSFQPMDVSKIDRADLERKGINWEAMEPHLKAMSYGHKSNGLIEMNPEMEPGGMRVPTKGRISLEEQPDSSIKAIPHYYQENRIWTRPCTGQS